MTRKGYSFEHEIEQFFLDLGKQTRDIDISRRSYRVPVSGSIQGFKGDIVTHLSFLPKQFLVECKSRASRCKVPTFYVEKHWLAKLSEEAQRTSRIPLFALSFKGRKKNRVWFLMPYTDFVSLFGNPPQTVIPSKALIRPRTYIIRNPQNFSIYESWILVDQPTFASLVASKQ